MLHAFSPENTEPLAEVYRDTVRTIDPQAKTEQQAQASALYLDDIDELRARLARAE